MSDDKKMVLLVGDNPFHGISHLSQKQARTRGTSVHGVWMTSGELSHVPSATRWQGGLLLQGMDAYVQNLRAITVQPPGPVTP